MADTSTPPTGTANTQGLAPWASGYISDYLGRAQQLGNEPTQIYQGPLTAGASDLQNKAFTGIGGLTVPAGLGEAATNAGQYGNTAANLNYMPNTTDFGTADANKYMNPYLQTALNPQLEEARRQSQITAQNNAAAMTKAGAFGGGRQAIMSSENDRNLGTDLSKITGTGYNTAYNKAMEQFNADQDRRMKENQFGTTSHLSGLSTGIQGAQAQGLLSDTQNKANAANLNTQMNAGDVQRGITAEGIAADKAEWLRQKDDPFTKVNFQRDAISGLPVGSMTNSAAGLSGVAGLISAMGGAGALNSAMGDANSPLAKLLASLGIGT
jgi:hypothetical protein